MTVRTLECTCVTVPCCRRPCPSKSVQANRTNWAITHERACGLVAALRSLSAGPNARLCTDCYRSARPAEIIKISQTRRFIALAALAGAQSRRPTASKWVAGEPCTSSSKRQNTKSDTRTLFRCRVRKIWCIQISAHSFEGLPKNGDRVRSSFSQTAADCVRPQTEIQYRGGCPGRIGHRIVRVRTPAA